MPLCLPQLNFAIICEGNELETFGVKQEGPSLVSAFVASAASKQFSVKSLNNLVGCDLALHLHIDGELVQKNYLRAQQYRCMLGIYRSSNSVLPFKFQELKLVDPDVEAAPAVPPEIGTINLRAYRVRVVRTEDFRPSAQYGLHRGPVSERSKKAGWHHVSTDDEIPTNGPVHTVFADYIDPPDVPCATFKVFYRPRALLMAQDVIPRQDVPVGTSKGPRINDRKRTREDALPGPSKRHAGPAIKNEAMSGAALAQRIRELQAELNSLMDGRPSSSLKREVRSPSPIVVGKVVGEVVDLTRG